MEQNPLTWLHGSQLFPDIDTPPDTRKVQVSKGDTRVRIRVICCLIIKNIKPFRLVLGSITQCDNQGSQRVTRTVWRLDPSHPSLGPMTSVSHESLVRFGG